MKFYIFDGPTNPTNINLDELLNRYRNYDFHFYTEYLSDEGIFTYEKNVLYKECVSDKNLEYKTIGEFEITIDNSVYNRQKWFQLPSEHKKEIIYKYAFSFKNFQFSVECIRSGDKCVPIDTYFEIKDVKMLDIQETANSFNEFLSTLK